MSAQATPSNAETNDGDRDVTRDDRDPVRPDLPPTNAMPTDAEANIIPTDSPGG